MYIHTENNQRTINCRNKGLALLIYLPAHLLTYSRCVQAFRMTATGAKKASDKCCLGPTDYRRKEKKLPNKKTTEARAICETNGLGTGLRRPAG